MTTYFGKYRGTVVTNIDPLQQGRVQVEVPAILGDGQLSWAMPCTPYAGNKVGLFAIPPIGANIWVEFEGGDPDYPIWSGCFWGKGELPVTGGLPSILLLQTEGAKFEIDGSPVGGLTIEVSAPIVSTPLTLKFDNSGIQLVNGASTIKLTAASVSVNDGALEVI